MADPETAAETSDPFPEGRTRLYSAGFVICILVYVFVVIGYAYWYGKQTEREIFNGIDQRLLVAAVSLKHMLPEDFQDRAVSADSVSYAEEMKNRRAVNQFAAETQFRYLYTLVEKNGRFFFSAPTVTDEEARQRRRWYFYPYDDIPEAFKKAFSEGTVQYASYTDRWGAFRSIALPQESPGGRRYLACADYDISYIEGLLQKSYLHAALVACLFLLFSFPLVLLFRAMYLAHARGFRTVNRMLSESRARLEEQVSERTAALETSNQKIRHQNRYLEALHRISLGLVQRLDVDDLLRDIIKQACDLGDTPHTYVYLYDPDTEELELKFGRGFYENMKGYRMKPGQGLTGQVFASGSPLHIEDYGNWSGRDRNEIFDTLQSVLGIPLVSGKQVFGVIGLGYLDEKRKQDETICTVMNHFAELAAIAIDKARLYTTLEQELRKRKQLEAERLEMEKRLFQAEKVEAIGTLAGGVAHDFNNLLMGIQGRASLMALSSPPPELREHVAAIEAYVQSAADLTQQLLGYARRGKYEVKAVDLNELVTAGADMFGRTRKEVRIHRKIEQTPCFVEADRRQIEQVLLNILVNAWQAMPDGGDITVETARVEVSGEASGPEGLAAGCYGKVSVTDSGVGMDEATRKRIFDPFFTTKDKSRGTGLGLASADGIVRNHGGIITVQSEAGRGSTFDIFLPALKIDFRAEGNTGDRTCKGAETILLVDDEAMIREVGAALLERLGYRVETAESGEEAVRRVTEGGESICLVILDLVMPGMDGRQTFDGIRKVQPYMPVLLSSGYSIDGDAQKVLQRGANGFIQKPFSLAALSHRVQKVLCVRNPP
jgi:signal transduction histidine kinase